MYFNPKKLFISSRKYDPGCSHRIRIQIVLPKPDPGVKRARDPGFLYYFAFRALYRRYLNEEE
jgi:hypothetical protein